MDNKKFELPLTTQALGELSATTAALSAALKSKKEEIRSRMAENERAAAQKSAELVLLQNKTAETLQSMDNLISQIDNVLENNGTSNNNN